MRRAPTGNAGRQCPDQSNVFRMRLVVFSVITAPLLSSETLQMDRSRRIGWYADIIGAMLGVVNTHPWRHKMLNCLCYHRSIHHDDETHGLFQCNLANS